MMAEHLKFLQLFVEHVSLFVTARMAIVQVKLDGHIECEHELVFLKKTSANVRIEYLQEIGFELADPRLGVLALLRNGEALDKELSEILHRELVHGVQLRHLLEGEVKLGCHHGHRLEVPPAFLYAFLNEFGRLQLVLYVICDLLGLI
jgi:hypothetical protein